MKEQMEENKKSIVVYYSRRGNNYVNGMIVDLKTGNTETVAGKISQLTGSDLFRIDTEKPYPADYHETTDVSKRELLRQARPKMKETINQIESYDIIYLGYPNWWSTMPMVMFTFLESFDTKGKTIIPFCTHEGSRLGHSETDIKKLCPKATVLPGLAIRGSHANNCDKELEDWLRSSK